MQSRGPIVIAVLLATLVGLALAFPATAPKVDTGAPAASPGDGSPATADSAFTGSERAAIGPLVREYLLDNPNVIVEAMQRLEANEHAAEARRSSDAIAANRAALFETEGDPYFGSSDAAIVMVEFFDYQCPYCKRVAADVIALAEENDDLKIVMKEFPIFGEPSLLAARAALAADRQGKYREFHDAMMGLRGAPSEDLVERAAARIGLDREQFRNDMNSPEVSAALEANRALAERIGVRGTPAFIIGGRLIPGAIDKATMQDLVVERRGR